MQAQAVRTGGVDTFLSCTACGENFDAKGERQPMSLKCGHTFCSGRTP